MRDFLTASTCLVSDDFTVSQGPGCTLSWGPRWGFSLLLCQLSSEAMAEPQTAIVLSHWPLGNRARRCVLEPDGVSPECSSNRNHSHLDYMQTPGILGCEGVRQNKIVARQSEEPASTGQTRAGGPLLPVCLSVPIHNHQFSLRQTIPPGLSQQFQCLTSVGDFKIKKVSPIPPKFL